MPALTVRTLPRVLALTAAGVLALAGLAVAEQGSAQSAGAAAVLAVPADYPTIAAAVAAAVDGDEIDVAAGTYAESLTVSKTIALVGAEGAKIAGGVTLAAPATLRGLTIERSGTPLTVQPAAAGALVQDNTLIGDGTVPIGVAVNNVAASASSPTTFRGNTLRNLGLNDGGGIWAFGSTNVVISGNTFDNSDSGPAGVGVNVGNGSSAVTIADNGFSSLENAVVVISTKPAPDRDIVVSGNTIATTSQGAIFLGGSNLDGVSVSGNTFSGVGDAALQISNYPAPGTLPALRGVVFSGNTVSSAEYGIRVSDGAELAFDGAVVSSSNQYGTISSGTAIANGATSGPAIVSNGDVFGAATVAGPVTVPSPTPPAAPSLPTTEVPAPAASTSGADGQPLQAPVVAETPAPPAPGETLAISYPAGTYQPFEWVFFAFYSVPADAGSAQAGADGSLSAAVTVPTSVPAGAHTLVATGSTSGVVATSAVSIAAAPRLAATGVNAVEVWSLGAGGIAVLALGAFAVAVAQRRTRRG